MVRATACREGGCRIYASRGGGPGCRIKSPQLVWELGMLLSPVVRSSSPPPRSESPRPTNGGPSAESVPLAIWNSRTLTKTFQEVTNQAMKLAALSSQQPADKELERNPARLSGIASLGVPQWIYSGPIETFAQARESQRREFDAVAHSMFGEMYYLDLGQGPKLLAEHLVTTKAPFDTTLVAAFAKMEPRQQTELLRLLQHETAFGWARCKELMAQLPATEQGPWMVLLLLTPLGSAVCRTLMGPLSAPERLSLGVNALHAGMSVGEVRDAMRIFDCYHPISWELESLAACMPEVECAIKAGDSFAIINMKFGPFFSAPAIQHIQLLFCTTRATEQVRSGEACDDVLRQWSSSTAIFDHPSDLRFLVFRDDAVALSDYEAQHGLAAEPDCINVGSSSIVALGEASRAASAGVPIDQILQLYQLDDGFRHRLEMSSCYGVAGRKVFAGTLTPEQALEEFHLRPDGLALDLLETIAQAGLQDYGPLSDRETPGSV